MLSFFLRIYIYGVIQTFPEKSATLFFNMAYKISALHA